MIASNGSFNWP
jgi:hypothetical protein